MKIALLTGGSSSEREIALLSSKNVQSALEVHFDVEVFDLPSDTDRFVRSRDQFACAVPIFHGRGGEDGLVQGFLETLGMPYILSSVEAHAIGMNKEVCKKLLQMHGFKTPKWSTLGRKDSYAFEHPVVVKPFDSGSSVGVHLVHEKKNLQEAIDKAFSQTDRVLIEELIQGREFTVAVIDGQALPVIEIKSKNEFFDLESKYDPNLCEEICPAQIDTALSASLMEMARAAHELIGARHISRTDMIVDETGDIWFLEINTIPGLTNESLLPKALRAAELNLADLLKKWIHETMDRHEKENTKA